MNMCNELQIFNIAIMLNLPFCINNTNNPSHFANISLHSQIQILLPMQDYFSEVTRQFLPFTENLLGYILFLYAVMCVCCNKIVLSICTWFHSPL